MTSSSPAIYNAYKGMQSPTGSNVWNTTLLIGWDEPGGTYDHVPPPSVPPPDPSAPVGEHGFAFDRSGYRVPAVIVSPWVAEGEVFNEEYRHTSLIATLREQWALGDPFTARDAAARTFSHVVTLDTPRDPQTWPDPKPRPVPQFIAGHGWASGKSSPRSARTFSTGYAGTQPNTTSTSRDYPQTPRQTYPAEQVVNVLRGFLANWFPLLASEASASSKERT